MKRIFVAVALLLTVALLACTVSCGGGNEEDEIYYAINYDELALEEYVKVGQYKDLEITMSPVSINMNIIEEALKDIIEAETTVETYETPVTDRITEHGDYVEISYKAYFDGEYYAAGSSDSVCILLAEDNGFFEWLDDDLYGIMPGTTVETKGTLPTDSYYGAYSGEEGTFVITLEEIRAHHHIPELTDEMVAKHTEYDSIDAYGTALYDELYQEAEATLENEKLVQVWTKIMESAEILEYPEQQVMYYYTSYRANIEAEADQYGHSYEEHLEAIGVTDEDVMDKSKSLVYEELVFYYIVRAENYSINDEEYAAGVAKYAAEQGMTVEQMETYYEKDYIKDNILWDKVLLALKDMTTFVFE